MNRFINSFKNAWAGYRVFLSTERNGKIEHIIALLTILLGFVFGISAMQWLVILFCIALVVSLEMINSSIEKFCDVVSPKYQPVIKTIKDIAAGAVLIAAVFSLVIGCIIFIPILVHLIK